MISNDNSDLGKKFASEKSATLFQTEYSNWQDDRLDLIYMRDYVAELSMNDVESWQTYQNNEYGFEMRYPAGFLWQDDVENVSVKNCGAGNFLQISPCPQSTGYSSAKLSLNGREYRRCRDSKGAVGSRYENYWYFGLSNGECFSFKFTVHYTNCGVYGMPDEPAYQQCEKDNQQKDERMKTIESTFKISD